MNEDWRKIRAGYYNKGNWWIENTGYKWILRGPNMAEQLGVYNTLRDAQKAADKHGPLLIEEMW